MIAHTLKWHGVQKKIYFAQFKPNYTFFVLCQYLILPGLLALKINIKNSLPFLPEFEHQCEINNYFNQATIVNGLRTWSKDIVVI